MQDCPYGTRQLVNFIRGLGAVSRVCKRMKQVTEDDRLWRRFTNIKRLIDKSQELFNESGLYNPQNYKELVRVMRNRTILDYHITLHLVGNDFEMINKLAQSFATKHGEITIMSPLNNVNQGEKHITMLLEFRNLLVHLDIKTHCGDTLDIHKFEDCLVGFDLTRRNSSLILELVPKLANSGYKSLVGINYNPQGTRQITSHDAKNLALQHNLSYSELGTETSYNKTIDEVFSDILIPMIRAKKFSTPTYSSLGNPFLEKEVPIIREPVKQPRALCIIL